MNHDELFATLKMIDPLVARRVAPWFEHERPVFAAFYPMGKWS